MNRRSFILTLVSLAKSGGVVNALLALDLTDGQLPEAVQIQCLSTLTDALNDPSLVNQVHAAEPLIALQHAEAVLKVFRAKRETNEPKERVLVWRVLARAEGDSAARKAYVDHIRGALLDPQASDHIHAMEALAKLNEPPATDAEQEMVRTVASEGGAGAPFALWRLAQAGDKTAVARLTELLKSDDEVTRIRAIYTLARVSATFPEAHEILRSALVHEPANSPVRPMLLSALGGDSARELLRDTNASVGDRYFAALSLADSGSPVDYSLLQQLLTATSSDLRVGAAYAMLRIDARQHRATTTTRPSQKQ
jgi:HEAT repeat protein